MIYTGKIEQVHQRHDGRSDEVICKGFRWSCSCGEEQKADTFQANRNACEDALDKHLIRAHSAGHHLRSRAGTPPEGGDPVIAVEGVPNYITQGERVEVVEGSWMGKRGTVTGFMADPEYVTVRLDNDCERRVKACTLAPLDESEEHDLNPGDRVKCTETGEEGIVSDPLVVEGVRIRVDFDNGRSVMHPIDTLKRRHYDESDSSKFATKYGVQPGSTLLIDEAITYHHELMHGRTITPTSRCMCPLEVYETKLKGEGTGEFGWKCGGHIRGHDFTTREQAVDAALRHLVRCHPRIHAHEDLRDAIERPPDRDASHDVRHRVPSSQENAESDQTQRPSTFNIVGSHLIIPCSFPRRIRWSAFDDEELKVIQRLLSFAEGTHIYSDHQPVYDQLSKEVDLETETRNKDLF